MKYVVALLLICCIGAPVYWVHNNFTLMQFGENWVALKKEGLYPLEVASGSEWVFASPTQAAECMTGGGCAIFSQRELMMALQQFLMRRGKEL
jgi:hypothetical protein